MREAILSWYAYAQAGPAGTALAVPSPVADLDDPEQVVELMSDARRLDAELSAAGWRHLWSRYGLEGLIDLARHGDWPRDARDEDVAEALVSESLAAGYDPVSGEFGHLDAATGAFEPAEQVTPDR